jgi:hypothetical protein
MMGGIDVLQSVWMEKVFENIFKKPLSQKVQIYLQGDLMQNQVVKVMVPEWLGPQ